MIHIFIIVAGNNFIWVNTNINQVNTIHWLNVGLVLAHRHRRWYNIKPALGERSVCDIRLRVPLYLLAYKRYARL